VDHNVVWTRRRRAVSTLYVVVGMVITPILLSPSRPPQSLAALAGDVLTSAGVMGALGYGWLTYRYGGKRGSNG